MDRRKQPPRAYEEPWFGQEPYGMIGAAGYVSADGGGMDRVEALRNVVEEVTRKPVARAKKGPGFY